MANWNNLDSYNPSYVGYYLAGVALNVPLGVAANATATIPMFQGGVTSNIGGNYIVRRITVRNPSGTVAAANISVSGPLAGQIVSSQGLATVSGVGKYKDFTISATYVGAGNVTVNAGVDATTQMLEDQFLYVNVLAAAAANNTVDIVVFAEPVKA